MVYKNNFSIRQAETKDIKAIVELYKKGLEALGYNDWKEDLLIKKITESFVLAPCFVIEKDDKLIGMAGLTLVTIAHSGVASLADYMFYIEPEARNIKTLNALVSEVKDFAAQNNFPLRLFFTLNEDEAVKRRLLKVNGFKIDNIIGTYNGK